jgi:hypothetical protein
MDAHEAGAFDAPAFMGVPVSEEGEGKSLWAI